MMSRIGRHLREGFFNVIRNGWMSFAAISAVMVTLAVLGFSLVLTMNAAQMSKYVTSQLEFSAFMNVSASQQAQVQLTKQVQGMADVKSVQLITQKEGLAQMEAKLGAQYKDILTGLKSNPIPPQLIVTPTNPRDILQVSGEVKQLSGVVKVRDPHQIVGAIFSTLDVIRDIGIVFVIALFVTSMFLISNTIRITIFSRRREIEIMKLVGATNWFIRWPFIVEGMLIGLFGAIIPLAMLGYGYQVLYSHANGMFRGIAFPLVQTGDLVSKLAIVMIGIGLFIGIWGGTMSVRKFLRV